jgi:DNA repair photolyase
LKEELARLIEPNALAPSSRVRALNFLSESGYFTTARFFP